MQPLVFQAKEISPQLEELFGQVWQKKARREGHFPYHRDRVSVPRKPNIALVKIEAFFQTFKSGRVQASLLAKELNMPVCSVYAGCNRLSLEGKLRQIREGTRVFYEPVAEPRA